MFTFVTIPDYSGRGSYNCNQPQQSIAGVVLSRAELPPHTIPTAHAPPGALPSWLARRRPARLLVGGRRGRPPVSAPSAALRAPRPTHPGRPWWHYPRTLTQSELNVTAELRPDSLGIDSGVSSIFFPISEILCIFAASTGDAGGRNGWRN